MHRSAALSPREQRVTPLHCAAMGGLTALAIRLYEEFQLQPEFATSERTSFRTPEMCAAKQFNVAAWRSHRAGNHSRTDNESIAFHPLLNCLRCFGNAACADSSPGHSQW